jgi:hypothetical protein
MEVFPMNRDVTSPDVLGVVVLMERGGADVLIMREDRHPASIAVVLVTGSIDCAFENPLAGFLESASKHTHARPPFSELRPIGILGVVGMKNQAPIEMRRPVSIRPTDGAGGALYGRSAAQTLSFEATGSGCPQVWARYFAYAVDPGDLEPGCNLVDASPARHQDGFANRHRVHLV